MVLEPQDKQTDQKKKKKFNFNQTAPTPVQHGLILHNMASSQHGTGKSAFIADLQLIVTGPHAKNPHPGSPWSKR